MIIDGDYTDPPVSAAAALAAVTLINGAESGIVSAAAVELHTAGLSRAEVVAVVRLVTSFLAQSYGRCRPRGGALSTREASLFDEIVARYGD